MERFRFSNGALMFLIAAVAALASTASPAAADADDVVISEIMYNPESDLDSDEFVEVHNAGNTPVDMGNWCVDGVGFCFPADFSIDAGEFVVISPDPDRLQQIYGVTSAGTYDGALRNGGETIELRDDTGVIVHDFEYDDGGEWPVLPDGEGPSLELMALDARSSPWGWAASTDAQGHTAGSGNSTFVDGTPPSITDVSVSNSSPAAGEAVTVVATVENATATPRLKWRRNLGGFSTVQMSGAGSTFSATIPAQNEGDLVEYRIEADGVFDHSYPRVDDSRATIGIFYPRSLTSALPVFEWIIREADYASMITDHLHDDVQFESVLVLGDEVMTGALVRVRGSSSRFSPKVNFKWEFPKNHDLEAPNLLVEPIDEFAMQAEWSDRSYGRSLLTWRAYEMVGIPTAQTFKIRVERNGDFQGLYSYIDVYDKTWRERHDIQDGGSFYKADSSAFNQAKPLENRWSLRDGNEGLVPLATMLDVILNGTPAESEAYVRANFDVDQMIEYASITALAQHVDSASKNFYAYLPDETGRWQLIPWDLDHTWGNTCCPVFSDFVSPAEPGDKVNEMLRALLDVDEFEQRYFVRVGQLRQQILAPGLLEGIFDAEVGIAAPEAALDKGVWGQCCSVPFERGDVFANIQARRDAFDNDPRVGGDPQPGDFECTVSIAGTTANLAFAGTRGRSEHLRSVEDGWITRIEDLSSYQAVGQAGNAFFVRLRGNGYSDTPTGFTDVSCSESEPEPDEYECTVTLVGATAILDFAGPRGRSEQLRSVETGWIATVTGISSYEAVGSAGDSFFVRLRGNGYSDGGAPTEVGCS